MALQFSSSIKTLYASKAIMGANSMFGTNTPVTIYSGVQPSATDFIKNWSSIYRSDATNSSHLAHFLNTGWTRTNSTITMTIFPYNTTPIRNGTATWAVVWQAGANYTSSSWSSQYPPTLYFAIVPVTTTAGNGVIRFTSIDFTTTAPVTLIDAGFTIM